jgi:hypothetical protein
LSNPGVIIDRFDDNGIAVVVVGSSSLKMNGIELEEKGF